MREYPDEVKKAFAKAHGDGKDLEKGQRLKFQNDVAKDLLYGTYSHLVPEIEDAVDEEQDAGMAEWDLALDNISLAEDITQYNLYCLFLVISDKFVITSTRDTLFDAVHPLLQAIGTYAGCHVTLIAGNAAVEGTAEKGFFTA